MVDDLNAIRLILEGTSGETGVSFFAALVKSLTTVLGTDGAWVTEYLPKQQRLRARAFWLRGDFVDTYEYSIKNTPCEAVLQKRELFHIPDRAAELFPDDPDLEPMQVNSYMGAPLLDADGSVMGHLATIHSRPMPPQPQLERLFRIFSARAAAEVRRIRAEESVVERELRLRRLFNSAMDAMVELDGNLRITEINNSAERSLMGSRDQIRGRLLEDILEPTSAGKIGVIARELKSQPQGRQYLWIPGGLKARRLDGEPFPAEATLSFFTHHDTPHFTLIFRNVHDQLAAESAIQQLTSQTESLRAEVESLWPQSETIGRCRPIRSLMQQISQVAPTDATVLVCGETGTGKELVAREIHRASARADKPLIKVNCAAVPATLIESEFFGHEKGAFTGATQARRGRFALADGGTIFLDEIGELPLELQPKLLRVLQEGEFELVGSSQTLHVDVRVIAATNRDLKKAVESGSFREDLYYRLNVFPISVPPLRERGDDIILIAEHLARGFGQQIGRSVRPLTASAQERLKAYSWPGNVRELRNVVERAVILAQNGILDFSHLDGPSPAATTNLRSTPAGTNGDEILDSGRWRDLEIRNIRSALEKCRWRVAGDSGAANLLGMHPSTLSSRMKALGIRRPD